MIYQQGLTIEDIKKVVEQLESQRPKPFNLVESPLLKGMQFVIKSGSDIYYFPDLKTGEVKVIEVPTFDEILTDCGRLNREAVEKGIKF